MDTAHTAHACRPLPSLQGRWGGIGMPLVWNAASHGLTSHTQTMDGSTHRAGPACAGNCRETSGLWGEDPGNVHFAEGKETETSPPRRAEAIARTLTPAVEPTPSGFSLPEFALLSLNFLWNSDLAASKLSKEETLRRLWKLPPGRDRKNPHAGYDPRGPSTGGSCFGDECCRVGSASRLGLRSFSRRDSVSDCIQFSLGDVFKSLKIRESPPGFKTARRKRCIRRSPRVLGGKVREPG